MGDAEKGSKADSRFTHGNEKVSALRSSVVPLTIAAGLAGYVYSRTRSAPSAGPPSAGPDAFNVLKEWQGITPAMERHRPPRLDSLPDDYIDLTKLGGHYTVRDLQRFEFIAPFGYRSGNLQ